MQHLAASDCDPSKAASGLTERSLARTLLEEMHEHLRRVEHSEYRFGCHISGRGQVRTSSRAWTRSSVAFMTIFRIAADARGTSPIG